MRALKPELLISGPLSDILTYWKDLFVKELGDINRDKKTIENYSRVVDYFIEFSQTRDSSKLSELDSRFINNYISFRNTKAKKERSIDELAYWTKQNDVKVIRLFLDFIEEYSYDASNMSNIIFGSVRWNRVKIPFERKDKPHYGAETVEKYLVHLDKDIKNKRDEFSYAISFIFKLCLYGGLRATEATKVKFSDFSKTRSTKDGVKVIDLTIKGKGRTTATNPIPYDPIKKEYSYFKRGLKNKKEDMLFLTKTGKKMTRFTLYRYFEEISKKLNLDKKGIHIIRHTFANNLNDLGIDLGDIQHLMRHADVSTTTVYTAKSSKRIDAAISKL